MNTRHGSSILVSFALTAALLLPGCHHGKPKVQRKTAEVAAAGPVADAVVPGRIVAPGLVEAWDGEVRLSAQESGWIAQLLVTEGQIIMAGQLLARLDDDVQKHAVDVAKAEVAEAAAGMAKISHGATAEDLQQARADYDAATIAASLADSEGARAVRLDESGVIARTEVDRATSAARIQAAAARAAEARRNAVQKGARAEDRTVARERLAAARARLEQAESSLARRRIVAPVAGTVLTSRLHVGEFFVVGGAPLLVMGDLSRLQVRLEVDEIDSPRVTPGAPCSLHADDGTKLADGTVVRAAPKMGRRAFSSESPTARNDVRVREVFVEVPGSAPLVPGQRVWGRTAGVP